jgi:non-heme chloroperoxidase
VAVDRRGFGKSEWSGNMCSNTAEITYNTFAMDTVHVLEELDVENIVFVAASMGCGETLLAYFESEWVRERCKVRERGPRAFQHNKRKLNSHHTFSYM